MERIQIYLHKKIYILNDEHTSNVIIAASAWHTTY
jgi:hypothetical protein